MRWNTSKPEYKLGDTRFVRRFLWWPLCIEGETRWLEIAVIRQKFSLVMVAAELGGYGEERWMDDSWSEVLRGGENFVKPRPRVWQP